MQGSFDWTGFDYRGEESPEAWPATNSYFGMLDLAGFPKDAAYVLLPALLPLALPPPPLLMLVVSVTTGNRSSEPSPLCTLRLTAGSWI